MKLRSNAGAISFGVILIWSVVDLLITAIVFSKIESNAVRLSLHCLASAVFGFGLYYGCLKLFGEVSLDDDRNESP